MQALVSTQKASIWTGDLLYFDRAKQIGKLQTVKRDIKSYLGAAVSQASHQIQISEGRVPPLRVSI